MDKIIIKGLEIFAYHGVNPEEKVDGQPFVLDITLDVDLSKPCQTDNVDDTVSYAKVVKLARAVMQQQSDDLIERAAQRVADAILEQFAKAIQVDITLKKPKAPIKAEFDYVAVRLLRTRN